MTANPYYGVDFLHFFGLFFGRLAGVLSEKLAPDEVQVLVLWGISISSACVGCWLILRKLAMLANSLSHTTLLGVAIVFLWNKWLAGGEMHGALGFLDLLVAASIAAVLTTLLTEVLNRWVCLQEDASNGIVFSLLFAFGILLVTLFTRNAHVGVELIMGNADMVDESDIKLSWLVALGNIALVVLLFRGFLVSTFDPIFSSSVGLSGRWIQYLLMFQVAITAVSAFRAVGVLMVLAFVIGPPLTARRLTHRLPLLLILSCVVGMLASLFGVALSRHLYTVYDLPLSTGGLVVCVILVQFLLVLLYGFVRNFFQKKGRLVEGDKRSSLS